MANENYKKNFFREIYYYELLKRSVWEMSLIDFSCP